MPKSNQKVIYYVGWNNQSVCSNPFFTKKAARKHGAECDYEKSGAFIIEVPVKITPIIGTESNFAKRVRERREKQVSAV